MHDLLRQYTTLSHEKRVLLELLLREEGLNITQLPIVQQPGEADRLPLSFGQQRLWFPSQMQLGNPAYNMAYAVRLMGALDVGIMERALQEIVRRHDSLRTRFPDQDGQPYQCIAPPSTWSLSTRDLRDVPKNQREAAALQQVNVESQQPFDLTHGPLLRTVLFCITETEYIFLLALHHIVADGWSIAVFIKEFITLYTAFSEGKPSPLTELPIQYPDFAHWQQNWLSDEMLDSQIAYWKSQLAGAPLSLKLPTDRPRPAVQTYRGAHQAFALSLPLTASLKALSTQENATVFMTLLAAFQALLHLYTGEDDIVVGTDVANRNRIETEKLIGFFSNQLVLRTDLSQNPTFLGLLSRVREMLLDAYAHQDVPFETLVKALNPKRNLSYTP
ncbi:MAG: condensation domain-containing protein, partial [Ktedonobacteraceae bacterium]